MLFHATIENFEAACRLPRIRSNYILYVFLEKPRILGAKIQLPNWVHLIHEWVYLQTCLVDFSSLKILKYMVYKWSWISPSVDKQTFSFLTKIQWANTQTMSHQQIKQLSKLKQKCWGILKKWRLCYWQIGLYTNGIFIIYNFLCAIYLCNILHCKSHSFQTIQ